MEYVGRQCRRACTSSDLCASSVDSAWRCASGNVGELQMQGTKNSKLLSSESDVDWIKAQTA